MNIADKLKKKIETGEIEDKGAILIELDIISVMISNVEDKLEMLKYLADKRYEKEKSSYALARTIALDTAVNLVKINLAKEGE